MLKQVYTSSFGFITVDDKSPLYNGKTIQGIECMPFNGWINEHKKEYIDNCKKVIECQMYGFNQNEIECLKNRNFNLVVFYLKNQI